MAPKRIEVGLVDTLLKDGTMKEIPFPNEDSESKILLSRVGGTYYATSNKCTHYGASLIKGVLSKDGRVVCPWHGACFNVCTGDIEDAPGMNSLHSFTVETSDNKVFVIPPTDSTQLTSQREPSSLSESSISKDGKGVIVIGGGAGGGHAVEQLRESGYSGRIRVISSESYLPIDRTKLSKALIPDAKKIALRGEDFYKKLSVDFMLGTEVKSIDFKNDSVTANGETYEYDSLIIATGSTPNRIPVTGHDLKNIFVIRTVDHAAEIDAALGSDETVKKNVVVIGSSFIGMEAALASSKRANVTVVGMDKVPFEAILGKAIGSGIQKFHEKQGTKFYLEASLSHFGPSKTDPTSVGSVFLKDGTELSADVVLLGVGVKPQTSLLKEAGLSLEKDGGVVVDGSLRIKQLDKGNVFAVGDIAHFPDHATGEINRIEHWNVASNHARTAAKTIAGKRDLYKKQALFWSAQGQQLRYVGTARSKKWEDVIVQGEPDDLKFIAYYYAGDEVVAIASMQNDPIVSHCSELLSQGKMLSVKEIKAGKNPLEVRLA